MNISLFSRVLAAVGGGYAVMSLLMAVIAQVMLMRGAVPAEAVFVPTLISFLVYAVIVMAVFHARTAARAWIGLVIAAVPLGGAYLLLRSAV